MLVNYLESSYLRCPDDVVITDGSASLTYRELREFAVRGAGFLNAKLDRRPVAVLMDKKPLMLAVFMAVLYSGRAYVALTRELGAARVAAVLANIRPQAIVTDAESADFVRALDCECSVIDAAELKRGEPAAPSDVPDTALAFIAGSRVASGYYNDPERTALSFVQNPLHSNYQDIVYKTGDLAKFDADGNIVLTTRRDHLVNLMGYRIELGEIEHCALLLSGVSAACAVHDRERNRLLLYYAGSADEKSLRSHLRNELPRYMQPQRTVKLAELPTTTNGKIVQVKLAEIAKEY